MKKSLLSIFTFMLATAGVNAQNVEVFPEQKNIHVKDQIHTLEGKKLVPTSRGVDDISTWYNFSEAYKEGTLLGQDLTTYVSWLWPDTTAHIVYSAGEKRKVGFHVIGSTFDPKDSNFLAVGEKTLQKFNPYTVDSVLYTQFYIRQLDSFDFGSGKVEVVDTVYLQYFDITGMDVRTYVYTGQIPQVTYYYGIPKFANFNTGSLLNSTAIKTDTMLLDKSMADSVAGSGSTTSYFGRFVQLAVGTTSKSTSTVPIWNNLTAYSIVFKPMRKANLGDTLVAYNGSTVDKKFNFYGVRLAYLDQHDHLITTPYRINNFFVSNFEVRYGQTVSIFRSYLPGTIFGSSIFMPHWVHITTSNLSTKGAQAGMTGVVAYPNPSSVNSMIDVNFNMTSAAVVTPSVVDMNGRTVRALDSKTCAAGSNTISINTEGMSKGMYMVVLNSSNGVVSTKINVQ